MPLPTLPKRPEGSVTTLTLCKDEFVLGLVWLGNGEKTLPQEYALRFHSALFDLSLNVDGQFAGGRSGDSKVVGKPSLAAFLRRRLPDCCLLFSLQDNYGPFFWLFVRHNGRILARFGDCLFREKEAAQKAFALASSVFSETCTALEEEEKRTALLEKGENDARALAKEKRIIVQDEARVVAQKALQGEAKKAGEKGGVFLACRIFRNSTESMRFLEELGGQSLWERLTGSLTLEKGLRFSSCTKRIATRSMRIVLFSSLAAFLLYTGYTEAVKRGLANAFILERERIEAERKRIHENPECLFGTLSNWLLREEKRSLIPGSALEEIVQCLLREEGSAFGWKLQAMEVGVEERRFERKKGVDYVLSLLKRYQKTAHSRYCALPDGWQLDAKGETLLKRSSFNLHVTQRSETLVAKERVEALLFSLRERKKIALAWKIGPKKGKTLPDLGYFEAPWQLITLQFAHVSQSLLVDCMPLFRTLPGLFLERISYRKGAWTIACILAVRA